MTTSADSQTTNITYDSLRRRSTTTYPTTSNVVTTYTYDNLNRITVISTVSGATTYEMDVSYVSNKGLVSQILLKLNGTTFSTVDLTYDSVGRTSEEKVTKTGPTVTYDKQYTYDKANRRLSVKDVTNGNWLETSTFDSSGRLTRIVVTAGTGSNPFSWPKGTTNVTCDANGNITQLWGRNVDTGAIFQIAHTLDFEQRVVRILLNNGNTVQNVYDGMGYRLKETTTSGGTPTEIRLINILDNRVIQQRDSTDTVTARFYWENGRMFKKDHSTSTKYFVPEFRNSPFTAWNNAGTFNRYDVWDTFGVESDESAGGSLSPFQLSANINADATQLTVTTTDAFQYPELGKSVTGRFRLLFQGAGGFSCPHCMMRAVFYAAIMDGGGPMHGYLWCCTTPGCTPGNSPHSGDMSGEEISAAIKANRAGCGGDAGGDPPDPPGHCGCTVECITTSLKTIYGTRDRKTLKITCPDGWACQGILDPDMNIDTRDRCWSDFILSHCNSDAGSPMPCDGTAGTGKGKGQNGGTKAKGFLKKVLDCMESKLGEHFRDCALNVLFGGSGGPQNEALKCLNAFTPCWDLALSKPPFLPTFTDCMGEECAPLIERFVTQCLAGKDPDKARKELLDAFKDCLKDVASEYGRPKVEGLSCRAC